MKIPQQMSLLVHLKASGTEHPHVHQPLAYMG